MMKVSHSWTIHGVTVIIGFVRFVGFFFMLYSFCMLRIAFSKVYI